MNSSRTYMLPAANVIQEVVRLMQDHLWKFETGPEYMHCSGKGIVEFLDCLYTRQPNFDNRLAEDEIRLLHNYVQSHKGDDFEDSYLMPKLYAKFEAHPFKCLGMRVTIGNYHQMEFLCGCVPRFMIMSGNVVAPKHSGSSIFESITDKENRLPGNRNWLI